MEIDPDPLELDTVDAAIQAALEDLARRELLSSGTLRAAAETTESLVRSRGELLRSLRYRIEDGLISYASSFNLTNLAAINEIYGVTAGDRVQEFARRTIELTLLELDPTSELGQTGGSQLVILHSSDDRSVVETCLSRIHAAVSGTMLEIGGRTLVPRPIIAGLELPEEALSAEDVLRMLAFCRLRVERTRRSPQIIDSHSDEIHHLHNLQQREDRVHEVTQALNRGSIDLHFQPVVDLTTGELHELEALARIVEGNRLIAAGEFIDAIHDLGEIVRLDQLVFGRVAELADDLATVTDRLFLNVAPVSLASGDFLQVMRDSLDRLQSAGIQMVVVLELTEQSLLEHAENVRHLNEETGVTFAVDDFGTGYSSFKTVADLALAGVVSHLKIDGSITRQLESSPETFKVVLSIVNLARSLELEVIAEVVESTSALERVRACGVRLGQGNVLCEPLALADLIERYSAPASAALHHDQVVRTRLQSLEPYLPTAFETFYSRLLSDPHFAVHFTGGSKQIRSLVDRQQALFSTLLTAEEATFSREYVRLGRLHSDLGVPFATFMRGAEILHDELLQVLAHVTPDSPLIADTIRFFSRLKDLMAKGYLQRMLAADRADLEPVHEGLHDRGWTRAAAAELIGPCMETVFDAIECDEPTRLVGDPTACPLAAVLDGDGNRNHQHAQGLHRSAHVSQQSLAYFLKRHEYAALVPVYQQIRAIHLTLCHQLPDPDTA
jgi:EAL domain-containing protein (putative c-di-GMP-specific phosphodiesterase class I)